MRSKRTRWLISAAVVAVAAVLAIGLMRGDDGLSAPIALDQTAPLPKITGKDLVTGRTIDLATYRGKPLFINAWAEWCIECREEAPVLKRFAAAHPEIAVVGIVGNSARDRAITVNRDLGWPWPSIFDPNGMVVLTTLELQNYPSTLFVDAKGVLRGMKRGVVSEDELSDVVKRLT
jgi:cytochrome c biogenesis protein CcmG/thiol:disulfide interchange protein DsbE